MTEPVSAQRIADSNALVLAHEHDLDLSAAQLEVLRAGVQGAMEAALRAAADRR